MLLELIQLISPLHWILLIFVMVLPIFKNMSSDRMELEWWPIVVGYGRGENSNLTPWVATAVLISLSGYGDCMGVDFLEIIFGEFVKNLFKNQVSCFLFLRRRLLSTRYYWTILLITLAKQNDSPTIKEIANLFHNRKHKNCRINWLFA